MSTSHKEIDSDWLDRQKPFPEFEIFSVRARKKHASLMKLRCHSTQTYEHMEHMRTIFSQAWQFQASTGLFVLQIEEPWDKSDKSGGLECKSNFVF